MQLANPITITPEMQISKAKRAELLPDNLGMGVAL